MTRGVLEGISGGFLWLDDATGVLGWGADLSDVITTSTNKENVRARGEQSILVQ